MEMNEDMLKEAEKLIDGGAVLPAEIGGFGGFFVSLATDNSIQAMSGLVHGGVSYKIGTKK